MLHVISVSFLMIEEFDGRVNDGEKYQATDVPHDV
jgi:hypothetical protein